MYAKKGIIILVLIFASINSKPLFSAEFVGKFNNGYGLSRDVLINGNIAYVAKGSNDLQVVDITDPKNPEMIHNWMQTGNESYALAIKDEYLFMAEREAGVRIFRLDNNGIPILVTTFDPIKDDFSRASNLCISGSVLFVGDFLGGLVAVDISNPEEPVEMDRILLPEGALSTKEAQGIAISGEYVYVANPWGGMAIIDITDPYNLSQIGYYERPEGCHPGVWDVALKNDIAIIMCQKLGVQILDISIPNFPILLKEIIFPDGSVPYGNDSPPLDALFLDTYVFVSNGYDGIYVIDLTNINDVKIVEHIVLPELSDESQSNYNYAWGMDISNDMLYVASGRISFYSYNIIEYFEDEINLDLDRNGVVDENDVAIFGNHFGLINCMNEFECNSDFNADNDIDGNDMHFFNSRY